MPFTREDNIQLPMAIGWHLNTKKFMLFKSRNIRLYFLALSNNSKLDFHVSHYNNLGAHTSKNIKLL